MPHLSTEDLCLLLKEFTYKPNWDFAIWQDPYEGDVLSILVETRNAYHPDQGLDLRIHTFIPPMQSDNQFYHWLLWRLLRVENHECREWARVMGKPIDDPHSKFFDVQ